MTRYAVDFLFIVSRYGIPFIIHDSRASQTKQEEQPDPILITGFLSAIQEFLKSLTNAELKVIDSGEDKIIIHRTELFSVAAISKVEFVNDILNIMIEIAEDFLHSFHDIILDDTQSTIINNFYPFYDVLEEKLRFERLLNVRPNDIFRRFPVTMMKVPENYFAEKYGSDFTHVLSKFNGRKTLYQILSENDLLAAIDNFELMMIEVYKDGFIKKLTEGQRQVEIISMMFRTFYNVFRQKLGMASLLDTLQSVVTETKNPLVRFIHFNAERDELDLREIQMALIDDPTLALSPEFKELINLLISFIATAQIQGKSRWSDINDAIKEVTSQFMALFPGDEFVSKFSDKLEFMII